MCACALPLKHYLHTATHCCGVSGMRFALEIRRGKKALEEGLRMQTHNTLRIPPFN